MDSGAKRTSDETRRRGREKTRAYRERMRAKGMRQITMWVRDTRGAEFAALEGARVTIESFRPSLALCVYHTPEDFVRLARFIDRLDLGYRLLLRHFTIHAEQTVLYAVA